MKWEKSLEYRKADPEKMKKFIGLKNKVDERGYCSTIDEKKARLIVANLKPKEYDFFIKEFISNHYAVLYILQRIELNRVTKKGHKYSVSFIKQKNKASGSPFFSSDTMRFFKGGKYSTFLVGDKTILQMSQEGRIANYLFNPKNGDLEYMDKDELKELEDKNGNI